MGIWKELKHSVNRSIGTSRFMPLDEMIARMTGYYAEDTEFEFTSPGTYEVTIPYNCVSINVTACGGGAGGHLGDKYTDSDGNAVMHGGNGGVAVRPFSMRYML